MGKHAKIAMCGVFLLVMVGVSAGLMLHPVQAAMPYKQAGLTERQAAAHLLNRFTFGPRPGDVDKVLQVGLENWLEQQLQNEQADNHLQAKLEAYPVVSMNTLDIIDLFPEQGAVVAEAKREGFIPKEGFADPAELKSKITEFEKLKGYHPQQELLNALFAQKLLRVLYSENQLAEVMTDFWFNHFNVSVTHNRAKLYVLAYERDAIRSHALGSFAALLEATASHPAMLYYLDNAESIVPPKPPKLPANGGVVPRKPGGINENYARELLELHTLGVAGGYSQADVQEMARIFTGWTVLPGNSKERSTMIAKNQGEKGLDVVGADGYWFRKNNHDASEKHVLGHTFRGDSPQEGMEVLQLLTHHPATARHIAYQFAQRFDNDHPPAALVEKLTKAFMDSGGDTKALVRALTASKEFWLEGKRPTKIKTSLEFVASALRSGNGEVTDGKALLAWLNRMGHPLYSCLPPTGYPENGDFWLNSGTLFTRINYSFALAYGNIPGVQLDPSLQRIAPESTGNDRRYEQGLLWSAPEFQIH